MNTLLHRLARWLMRKTAPSAVRDSSWDGPATIDAFRRLRNPTPWDLLAELKNTAWTCASINAAVCASFPPRLFVTTDSGQSSPKCRTKSLSVADEIWLRETPHLYRHTRNAHAIAEVIDHPLQTLLRQVNPVHNSFDLWELTELFLDVHGCAYWLLELDPIRNTPRNIWMLPPHLVTPKRESNSDQLVDYYEFRGKRIERISPKRIIAFRFPDPRDPYGSGISPLRAAFEQVTLSSQYAAMKRSIYDNTGLPSVVLSPDGVIGDDERGRLEEEWNRKFRHGGNGKALVAESSFKIQILSHSMGDLAALADMKATKEDIANAFHVPLPFLSGETNLANMQAADHLHKTLAITPRLRRRDEKLNERLIPWFDPSGRLFVASDDPTPSNHAQQLAQEKSDLQHGVRTINEVRAARGLAPVAWGDEPFTRSRVGGGEQ